MILQDDNFATIIKAVANGRMFTATLKMQFFSCFRVIWQAFLPCCSVQLWLCPYRLRRFTFCLSTFLQIHFPQLQSVWRSPKKICSDKNPVIRNRESLQKLFCSYARTGRFDCRCNAHFILHRTSDKSCRCKHNGICNTHACKTVPRL